MPSHEPETPEPPSLGSPPPELLPDPIQKAPSSLESKNTPVTSGPFLPLEGADSSPANSQKDDQNFPDLWSRMKKKFYEKLGRLGIFLAIVVAIWWHWPTINNLPGVPSLLHLLSQSFEESLPLSDPQKFSVAVSHLGNDQNGELELLLVDALQEFKGIFVSQFDRFIVTEEISTVETIRNGHEKARKYLDASGFDSLIWGTVIKHGTRTKPKLYWTVQSTREKEGEGQSYPITREITLPELFWEDLVEILRLLVVTEGLKFQSLDGHYLVKLVEPFIAKVRQLLDQTTDHSGWSKKARIETSTVLAGAYEVLGAQVGENSFLESAIHLYRKILQEVIQKREPLVWGRTQAYLGGVLARLGEREKGTARLEESVVASRAALKVLNRERTPLDWGKAQSNLGVALWRLGEREDGTAQLEESVAASRAALKVLNRERTPLDWGKAQSNLGVALWGLGEREDGTAQLEESVVASRAALQELTRKRAPLHWAIIQNNLGLALWRIGERKKGKVWVEEAVDAYRMALLERTRERVPLDWAITKMNLGNALATLSYWDEGTVKLEEAVAVFHEALQESTRERVPLYWANIQNNLGTALWRLGNREKKRARLEEAVVAYREALKEYNTEKTSHLLAITKENLKTILSELETIDRDFGP